MTALPPLTDLCWKEDWAAARQHHVDWWHRDGLVLWVTGQCAWLDYSLYHLDGEDCLVNLDELLAIEPLDAIEWTPRRLSVGDSGGHPRHWDLYRRILAAGKSVQAIGVRYEEVIPLLDACGGRGMFVTTGAPTETRARELSERVAAYR